MKELRVTGEVVEDTVYPNLYAFKYTSEDRIVDNDGKLDRSIEIRNFKIRVYIDREEFIRFRKPKLLNVIIKPPGRRACQDTFKGER